jgi:hypothetical protein
VDNANAKYTVKPQNQNILKRENSQIMFRSVVPCGGGWGGGGPKATYRYNWSKKNLLLIKVHETRQQKLLRPTAEHCPDYYKEKEDNVYWCHTAKHTLKITLFQNVFISRLLMVS